MTFLSINAAQFDISGFEVGMVSKELYSLLERIYECGLKQNRPECCEPIFEHQMSLSKNVKIGFAPKPILGNPRAPVVFIATNPKLRDDDMTYDSMVDQRPSKAVSEFVNYSINRHVILAEEDYRSQTSKARNLILKQMAIRMRLPPDKISIRTGAVFCTNIVQCPTENWRKLSIRNLGRAIESECSRKYLGDILRSLNPKIVIAAGRPAFR